MSPRYTGRVNVSVIIPVKDDERVFACVESVLAAGAGCDNVQILVVDNGSAPGFSEKLRALPPGVELLQESKPGAYAARNRAIDAAAGDIVFFTDADCLVEPGWIAAGLRCIEGGADIAQGFSGSLGDAPVDRLIQRRYQAHLLALRPGAPTECDTRNLAVRRQVFERLRFNDHYRRVGDTEFGLVAEAMGYRVSYWPAMRVDHQHEREIAVFLAKQACHGWGAQRLMREHPEVVWHGGHLHLVAKMSRWSRRFPGQSATARALCQLTIRAGRLLDRRAGRLPESVAVVALAALDKGAALSGHLMHEAGAEEPAPSSLLGQHHPRD